jgi:chaperone required for assembly of F1-ATPase
MLADFVMSTDAFLSMFGAREEHEPRDPMKAAQGGMRNVLPKRFYAAVSVELRQGLWHLLLDGKVARTPARQPLAVDNEAIAAAIADEWQAQDSQISPATMPLTRLVNAAIDGVRDADVPVREEIVRYAGSDLICYRAETPRELAERQCAIWDPLLAWTREALGADLKPANGIIHVTQPPKALTRIAEAVAAIAAPVPLAALSAATTISGSAVIALALAHGRLDADAAWQASSVDEDYQASVWGTDDEAVFRQANRRRDFGAAALALASSRTRAR